MILKDLSMIKIVDFGLSRGFSNTLSYGQSQVGSPVYMSPQAISGENYKFETDVWSVGVILYELITLDCPFKVQNLSQLQFLISTGQFQPITRKCSEKLIQGVNIMLTVDPLQRATLEDLDRHFDFPNLCTKPNDSSKLLTQQKDFPKLPFQSKNSLKASSLSNFPPALDEKIEYVNRVINNIQKPFPTWNSVNGRKL